jgi:hypothetical protein
MELEPVKSIQAFLGVLAALEILMLVIAKLEQGVLVEQLTLKMGLPALETEPYTLLMVTPEMVNELESSALHDDRCSLSQ